MKRQLDEAGAGFSMVIRVLFFGVLKDVAGNDNESVLMPDGSTVRDVLDSYRKTFPAIEKWVPSLAISVNREYNPLTTALKAGDEVAFLPPVSGGSTVAGTANRCAIVKDPIDTHQLTSSLQAGEDGALVISKGSCGTIHAAAELFISTTKLTSRWRWRNSRRCAPRRCANFRSATLLSFTASDGCRSGKRASSS